MTDTNTRDRWSDLEEFPDGKEGVQSRYVIVHQLRASADIQADEVTREWGRPATTDRAELMRKAADLVEALISHARAVEAENARLNSGVNQIANRCIRPVSRAEIRAMCAALTEPRAGEGL